MNGFYWTYIFELIYTAYIASLQLPPWMVYRNGNEFGNHFARVGQMSLRHNPRRACECFFVWFFIWSDMCWPHYTRIESAPELLETFCNWCMSPAGECVYAYVCVDFVWVFGRRDYPLRRDARSYTYTSMHNQSLLYIIRRGVYIDLLYI